MLMLTLNYRYRIYPNTNQQFLLLDWMEICRKAYNYALLEIKDWCNSRKCLIDRCSLEKEYIIPADTPFPPETNQLNKLPKAKKQFPRLGEVPSQVLQQEIKQLHVAWKYFHKRGFGFPRFKQFGQFKSLLFPQFLIWCGRMSLSHLPGTLMIKINQVGLDRVKVNEEPLWEDLRRQTVKLSR